MLRIGRLSCSMNGYVAIAHADDENENRPQFIIRSNDEVLFANERHLSVESSKTYNDMIVHQDKSDTNATFVLDNPDPPLLGQISVESPKFYNEMVLQYKNEELVFG